MNKKITHGKSMYELLDSVEKNSIIQFSYWKFREIIYKSWYKLTWYKNADFNFFSWIWFGCVSHTHTVVEKYYKMRSRFFYRKINIFTFLLKKLVKSWFHEIFWVWSRFPVFSTLCHIYYTKISWKQRLVKFSTKCNDFTEILQKIARGVRLNFRHHFHIPITIAYELISNTYTYVDLR